MRWYYLSLVLLIPIGCSESPKASRDPAKQSGSSEETTATLQTALLKPLLFAQKPATVISVTEAMQRKEGETVVVSGRLPPDKVKPFNTALAAFVMLAPESLDREDVKDEFDCDDAAT